jgi:hypothetical protein
MENHLIDVHHNVDPATITAETGGETTHGIRVVIGEGVTTSEAHKCLGAITNALVGDQIKLD